MPRPQWTRLVLVLTLLIGHAQIGTTRAADGLAEPVAMVTDVQGKATLTSSAGEPRELTIMSDIAEGAAIELAPSSRLVALWLKSGEEFSFAGPAAIRFTSAGPQTLSGAQPSRRASALEHSKSIHFSPFGVTQTAVVMRSGSKASRIQLLTLAGTRTLESEPEFRWQPIPGVRQYRFELSDMSGRALHERDVAGDSYRLPAAVKLEDGASYVWGISAQLPGGRKYSSFADFVILAAAERQRVESIRPRADASLAERVAFAAWLKQQGLRDEARKYWKDAATERPQDSMLQKLAAE